MLLRLAVALGLAATAVAHAPGLQNINPELGVPGFPDCIQPNESLKNGTDIGAAATCVLD